EFDGEGGNDTLTVDAVNGKPLVPGGVFFDGGSGSNTLVVNAAGEVMKAVPGLVTLADPVTVPFTNTQTINVNSAVAVNAIAGPDTTDRATAFVGLSANERFVQALYLDELGRPGSKAELDGWTTRFSMAGTTRAQALMQIATGIQHSGEARGHLVQSWYVAYLGRKAQGNEAQGWVNQLLAGQTEEQVLGQILASGEFQARAQTLISSGTADERFVQALFLVLLDRTGLPAEVSNWVNNLPAQGHQGVARGFLLSQEFRMDQFEGYYNALLHRPGDQAGLNNWLSSNLDVGAVRVRFEVSDEFFANG